MPVLGRVWIDFEPFRRLATETATAADLRFDCKPLSKRVRDCDRAGYEVSNNEQNER